MASLLLPHAQPTTDRSPVLLPLPQWGAGETDPLWEKPTRHDAHRLPHSREASNTATSAHAADINRAGTPSGAAAGAPPSSTVPVAPALEGQNAAATGTQ